VLAGVALAVFAIRVVLLCLEQPWFTQTLVVRYSVLARPEASQVGEAARRFVTSGDAVARSTLDRLMTADAVQHLDDVRRVLAGARTVTIVLGLALVVWVVVFARRRPRELSRALLVAAAILGAFVLVAGTVALTDFDAFFSAFHGLFFAPGTWTFPSDSLLIRLFPEPFWVAAGAAWAVGVLVMAASYAVLGWFVRRRSGASVP
jgi:integral membrane protein (TIGR01906 family)